MPKLPTPQAQAFVICKDIFHHPGQGDFILVRPTSSLEFSEFPARIRLSFYLHITGGHGSYPAELCLTDGEGHLVWKLQAQPLQHDNPLIAQQMALNDVTVEFPNPGHYDMAYRVAGDTIASQGLWVVPAPN